MTIREFAKTFIRSFIIGVIISAVLIIGYRATIKKSTKISKYVSFGTTTINMTKWETDIFGNSRLSDWEVLTFHI